MTTNILNRRNLLERRQGTDISLATQPNADLATTIGLKYDYAQIAAEHRDAIKIVAVDIRTRGERAKRDILAIGKGLLDVKERLPHGQFMDWCNTEFELSERTARNIMGVYERFKDRSADVALLSDTVLYMLASPQITNKAVEAVVQEATETNHSPSKARAEQIVAENTAKRGRKAKPAPVTIDSKATRVEKSVSSPGVGGRYELTNADAVDYIKAQLDRALWILPGYEQRTGDTEGATELRQIVAKMLAKLGQK